MGGGAAAVGGRTSGQWLLRGEERAEGVSTEWQKNELVLTSPCIPRGFVSPTEDGDRQSREGAVHVHTGT